MSIKERPMTFEMKVGFAWDLLTFLSEGTVTPVEFNRNSTTGEYSVKSIRYKDSVNREQLQPDGIIAQYQVIEGLNEVIFS